MTPSAIPVEGRRDHQVDRRVEQVAGRISELGSPRSEDLHEAGCSGGVVVGVRVSAALMGHETECGVGRPGSEVGLHQAAPLFDVPAHAGISRRSSRSGRPHYVTSLEVEVLTEQCPAQPAVSLDSFHPFGLPLPLFAFGVSLDGED